MTRPQAGHPAFTDKRSVEAAIREHALTMLWTNLAPTIERVLSKAGGRPQDKLKALELLWVIGRDPVVKTESKKLHAHVHATSVAALLEADPALREYLDAHTDVKQRLLAAPPISAGRSAG